MKIFKTSSITHDYNDFKGAKAGLKIGGHIVASGELKLIRVTKS